ncbi:MAG: ABC transporter permease [Anaerolineales bacterium]|nr:MAG: ABC transporter permease [Anaerolineales bacterium]
MLKLLLIGLKDLKLMFRDRAALLLMLLTPFLLTLGMGLVTGQFSGDNNSGISDIPVVIVNLDNDSLGDALVEIFHSDDLADLVEPTSSQDPEAARRLVDEDEVAAAIIIPAGFTQSVIPQNNGAAPNEELTIEFYSNPSRPTSAGIIKAILDGFLARLDEMRLSGLTTITQLLVSGRIQPQDANQVGAEMGERLQSAAVSGGETTAITLNTSTSEEETNEFNALAYFAPGIALMFLMYTVSYGGRSILAEKAGGTLPRLLVAPTNSTQVLGGKVFGIFLMGAAQMLILIGASTLFFGLNWGNTLSVVMLVLVAVFSATGWGLLITALARTPAQIGSVGSAVMLIFAMLGGSLIPLDNLPAFTQALGRITPNAWAMDGFLTLALGGTLSLLSPPILALLTMGILLFLISAALFGKKNLIKK